MLGGLQNHRVAAREGGRRFPGRHEEGGVPRRDAAHHADRLAQRVAEEVAGTERRAGEPVQLGRHAGPVAEDLGREPAHAARHEDRHAHVERLEAAELGGVRLEQIGDLVEDARTLARGRGGPGALVGGARGRHGRVDVRFVALGDDRDHGAVVRADALEPLARPAVDELAVDEELIPPCAALGAEGLGAACHARPPSERPT